MGYGVLCRRLNLRTLLVGCMVAGDGRATWDTCSTRRSGRAQAIEGLNGFGYTLAELALMDLAVRATPAGSEGLGFSLMVSVRNLALFGTDWFGSKLLDAYHFSFDSLVIANSVTTAVAVPLVFLLPGDDCRATGRGAPREGPTAKTAMEWTAGAVGTEQGEHLQGALLAGDEDAVAQHPMHLPGAARFGTNPALTCSREPSMPVEAVIAAARGVSGRPHHHQRGAARSALARGGRAAAGAA